MDPSISPEAVSEAADRILSSKTFAGSNRLQAFLRFAVRHAASNNTAVLKESVIGVEVFGKEPTFDPRLDPVVRVNARRLRDKLQEYYQGEGAADSIRIGFQKGSYVPVFERIGSEPKPDAESSLSQTRTRWRPRFVWFTALVLLSAAGAVGIWRMRSPRPSAFMSVAVLPLTNLSGDPSQDYLADGLTEQLITDLSRYRNLRVIARTSVQQYKGTNKPVPAIAAELNATAIVEGSFQRAGDRIRVTAQLIDAKTNMHSWSESYDRDIRSFLEVEAELAMKIAGQIHGSLAPSQAGVGGHVPNAAAHQLYLQARYELNKQSDEGLRNALRLFDQVLQIDPQYARAYAGIAQAHIKIANFYAPPEVHMPQARDAAQKAIDLDPSLADARVAMGLVRMLYDWDWDGAAQEFRTAVDLESNSAEAWDAWANYYLGRGRFDEAIKALDRALELSPFDATIINDVQWIYLDARRYPEALNLGKKALERQPGVAAIQSANGLSEVLDHHVPEGIADLRQAAAEEDSPRYRLFLALGLALAGQTQESRVVLRATEDNPKHPYMCAYEVASVYASLEQREETYRWLRKGLSDRCDCMVWIKVEPWLDRLQHDPGYKQFLTAVHLD